jgi:hypothetical protein
MLASACELSTTRLELVDGNDPHKDALLREFEAGQECLVLGYERVAVARF